jgi:hypothetical protein
MIDINDENSVFRIAFQLEKYSRDYWQARKKSAKANHSIEVLLASKMPEFRKIRNNIGYESARVMLMESGDVDIIATIKEYTEQKAEYEGLSKVCEALQSQISLTQSLIKNRKQENLT